MYVTSEWGINAGFNSQNDRGGKYEGVKLYLKILIAIKMPIK